LQKTTTIMSFSKESAVERAKQDLAQRVGIAESEITASASDTDFPDMSLGTPVNGEMSAQMISSGWRIDLSANGKSYEYRADKYQLRLRGFNGTNYIIES
jgi:hypothetical protein